MVREWERGRRREETGDGVGPVVSGAAPESSHFFSDLSPFSSREEWYQCMIIYHMSAAILPLHTAVLYVSLHPTAAFHLHTKFLRTTVMWTSLHVFLKTVSPLNIAYCLHSWGCKDVMLITGLHILLHDHMSYVISHSQYMFITLIPRLKS